MSPLSIDDVRAEIEALDAEIVRALLNAPTAPDADAPPLPAAAARQFPELWQKLCASYGAFLPQGFPAESESALLSALWRRIAVGTRVLEAKRLASPGLFAKTVPGEDRLVLQDRITYPEIERRVIQRATELATRIGHPEAGDRIAALFRDLVIPMTREIQVERLLAADASAAAPPGDPA